MSTEPGAVVSVPCLFYLFAERLVMFKSAPFFLPGARSPLSSGRKVWNTPLAEMLAASALWSLRERRCVSFELAQGPVESVRVVRMRVNVAQPELPPPPQGLRRGARRVHQQGDVSRAAAADVLRGGELERWLLAPTWQGRTGEVSDFFRLAFSASVRRPVRQCMQEACRLGYLDRPERLIELEGVFADAAERWERFQREESALYHGLLNEFGRFVASLSAD